MIFMKSPLIELACTCLSLWPCADRSQISPLSYCMYLAWGGTVVYFSCPKIWISIGPHNASHLKPPDLRSTGPIESPFFIPPPLGLPPEDDPCLIVMNITVAIIKTMIPQRIALQNFFSWSLSLSTPDAAPALDASATLLSLSLLFPASGGVFAIVFLAWTTKE